MKRYTGWYKSSTKRYKQLKMYPIGIVLVRFITIHFQILGCFPKTKKAGNVSTTGFEAFIPSA